MQASSDRLIDIDLVKELIDRELGGLIYLGLSELQEESMREKISSVLEEAAVAPVRADGIRPIISFSADDIRDQFPHATDRQVERILNADWGHLCGTSAHEVLKDQIRDKAIGMFPGLEDGEEEEEDRAPSSTGMR